MNSNNNKRRSRRGPSGRRPRNMNKSTGTKNSASGRLLRIGSDPPVYKEAPWNRICLVYEGPTDSDTIFLNSEITTAILSQMELTGSIEYRINKVHIYDLAGNAVGLIPRSTIYPQRYHGEFTDLPGRNHYAKIGYQWPKADQQVPLVYDGNALFEVGFYNAGASINSSDAAIYVYAWWRATTLIPAPPSQRFTKRTRPFPRMVTCQESKIDKDQSESAINYSDFDADFGGDVDSSEDLCFPDNIKESDDELNTSQ